MLQHAQHGRHMVAKLRVTDSLLKLERRSIDKPILIGHDAVL